MRLSDKKIVENRDRILQAAQACFVRKGFHSTTMQDICREADMSAGNIYRYFDSKEKIIEAFAEEELQWMSIAITDVPSSGDLRGAIVDTAFWTAATLTQDGRAELNAELFAEAGRNPRINTIYSKFYRQLVKKICKTLEVIESSDRLYPVHDKTHIAKIIIALVDGLVMNKIISPDFEIMNMRPVMETMINALFASEKN